MESANIALLDQARTDRDRAESYRHLAKIITSRASREALQKCAAELDDRAALLEQWAAVREKERTAERAAPSLAPASPRTL